MEHIMYQGNIIEVVRKDVEVNGMKRTFEFARRSPGTRLIIPHGDDVLLTKEFRHEIGGYDFRLPGGKVFDTLEAYNAALLSDIDIESAAREAVIKEAREEVGIKVTDIVFFQKSICGATVVWDLYYFVVNDFVRVSQELEEGEDIVVVPVDRETAKKMCVDGSISEERSALVLLRYLERTFGQSDSQPMTPVL